MESSTAFESAARVIGKSAADGAMEIDGGTSGEASRPFAGLVNGIGAAVAAVVVVVGVRGVGATGANADDDGNSDGDNRMLRGRVCWCSGASGGVLVFVKAAGGGACAAG